jgi:sigma-B regulation protein RsbU (phosphoserine phosphatase)
MHRKSLLRFIVKTLILSLPVMMAFAAVLVIVGASLRNQGRELLGQSEAQQVEVEAALISDHMAKAVADLRFVAHGHAMAAWLDDPRPEKMHMLSLDLLQLVLEKPIYFQARLLGSDGMELIRAESVSPGKASLQPPATLQRKADRPYFKKTIGLPVDSVFISRLDLNEEHGRVEVPHRPTLRIATPLFGKNGSRLGVLVFNLRASILLSGIERRHRNDWQFLLANGDGYWLKGPAPEYDWGFQIPSRSVMTAPNVFPRAWEMFRTKDAGRLFTEHGLFLFTSIYPDEAANKPALTTDRPDQRRDALRKSRWILAAHLPAGPVSRHMFSLISPLLIAFAVGGVIILAFAMVLAVAHNRLDLARRKEVNQSKALGESVMNLQDLIEVNERNITRLRETNSRLESILGAASRVSIIATDTEGTITLFNRGAENMLGYSASEMVGVATPIRFHLGEEMAERSRDLSMQVGRQVEGFEIFVESARQGGFDSRGWTYVRKDGTRLDVELVVTAIGNDVDGVTGFLGIAVDVTERNTALREREHSRSRLNSIIEAAVDGIFTVDTWGTITSANKAGAAIFGYEPEELIDHKVNILMEEPHRSRHDAYLKRYLTTGRARNIGIGGRELPGRHRDGRTIPLELAISESRTETEHFFTGILRDITERKQAEEALRQANQALLEKQRILDDDMLAAAQIQSSLLPQNAPNARGFTMDWLFKPSAHVGGDIFNILPLPGELVGLYLIDVSGHGPAAAMVTVSISQVLQPGSPFIQDDTGALAPDEVLRRVDRAFPLDRFDHFSTMFYLIFDPGRRRLHSSGAGHPPPLLARPGNSMLRLDSGGTVIGLGEPVPFASEYTDVHAGDVLLLYTDGCTEHTNSAGQQYGVERLETALAQRIHLDPRTLLEELRDELERFGEGAKAEDDISLVCLKFTDD